MKIKHLGMHPGRPVETLEVHVFERTHRYLHELPPKTVLVSFSVGDWCKAWLRNDEELEPVYGEYFRISDIREISKGVKRVFNENGQAFNAGSVINGLTNTEKVRAITYGSFERPFPVIPYSLIADTVMNSEFDILSLVG